MKHTSVKIGDGILGECHKKVINSLVNVIDANQHANTYVGEHQQWNADPEFTGKYVDLCVNIYERYGDEKALGHAKLVVDSMIENMRSDGYLGTLEKGNEFINFSVWNQTFTVFGMLSYYRATKDEKVLTACEKCVSFVMDYFVEQGNDILNCVNYGTEHPSILFILSDMYRFTGKEVYMKYMLYVVDRFKNSNLNFLEFDSILDLGSRKGIEIFVILLGILKYAELTGDTKATQSVMKYWQELDSTQIRNTGNGTIEEMWTENGNAPAMLDSSHRPNETCVAVGWIELSLYLFKITKDVRYINAIDKTLYNHMLASISENGDDFAYYQPNYGKKIRTTEASRYKCCRYRGFTLFTYMPDMLFMEDEEALIPMVYTDCEYASDSVKLIEKTNYPFEGDIHFGIDVTKNTLLKLRIPVGYDVDQLVVNHEKQPFTVKDGYINISLEENKHYDIDLLLTAKTIIEKGNIDGVNVAAVSWGQVLLALCGEDAGVVVNKDLLKLIRQEQRDKGYVVFQGKATKDNKEIDVMFTDYASADDYKVWFPVM